MCVVQLSLSCKFSLCIQSILWNLKDIFMYLKWRGLMCITFDSVFFISSLNVSSDCSGVSASIPVAFTTAAQESRVSLSISSCFSPSFSIIAILRSSKTFLSPVFCCNSMTTSSNFSFNSSLSLTKVSLRNSNASVSHVKALTTNSCWACSKGSLSLRFSLLISAAIRSLLSVCLRNTSICSLRELIRPKLLSICLQQCSTEAVVERLKRIDIYMYVTTPLADARLSSDYHGNFFIIMG
ncbi:hypothetical protein FF38_06428 [Lucilia cuprina]|uniref:Uncharacterized protein n=1 Tax=Lucilia cuprina TaxID=7375 RepID=A0A0L0CBI9_LUCCU|nr:hypothetical protein FF38_06428 [Lucilia cuprina]